MSEMEWFYVQCQYLAFPYSDFSMSQFLYVSVIYNASNESIITQMYLEENIFNTDKIFLGEKHEFMLQKPLSRLKWTYVHNWTHFR